MLAVAAAAAYFISGLCAIANFAWRQPLLDQFRLYETYLTLPFRQNIVQRENGHRPIVPSLVRVAEIHWLHTDQSLQIVLGAAFAAI